MYSDPQKCGLTLACKYQLIKYKPWSDGIDNVWDNQEATDEIFSENWNLFLQSYLGQT